MRHLFIKSSYKRKILLFLFLINSLSSFSQLDSIPGYIPTEDTLYIVGNTIRKVDTMVVYVEKIIPLEISAGIEVGGYHPIFSFIPIGENPAFSDKISKAHRAKYSYSASLNVGVKLSNWKLKIGAGIHNTEEYFRHSNTFVDYKEVKYLKTDTVETYTKIVGGETIYVYKIEQRLLNRTDTIRTDIQHSEINRYSYYCIPVALGYEWGSNKFHFNIMPTSSFLFLNKARRHTLAMSEKDEMVVLEDKKRFQARNTNLGLEVGLGYNISKRNRLTVAFNYNKSLSELYKDNSISQEVSNIGVKIGFFVIF